MTPDQIPDQTPEDFKKEVVQLIHARIQDRKTRGLGDFPEEVQKKIDQLKMENSPMQDLQMLLTDTLPEVVLSPQDSSTCCLYKVGGNECCVCNVSLSECTVTLHGSPISSCPAGTHGYNV